MKKIINLLFIAILGAFVFNSCVDKKFDEPDFPFTDPDITTNTSIRQIKDLLGSNLNYKIEEDMVFSAVVIANDSLGNFYKKIVVQDSTSGIEILIDGRNLYGKFPVGRRVFVKAKGLVLGSNRGVVQLGWTISEGNMISILSKDLNTYIVGGSLHNFVAPKEMKICDFDEYDISTLIKFSNVQFKKDNLNLTFADGVTKDDKSRTLADCSKNEFIIRTSGYAEFASDTLPAGNGSLVCVLGIYKYNDQAFECKRFQGAIRSLDDIKFDKERCGGSSSGDESLITIKSVRDMFANGQTIMSDKVKIKGVVISDIENKNLPGKNMVIQDETAGIAIRFVANHDFNLNDEVEIVVSNLETSEYKNLLQFNNVEIEAATVVGTGSITPRTATVQEILDNADAWESTLVYVKDAGISGGNIYKDFDVLLTDATGSVNLHTSTYATFAESALPTGTVKVTAVVSQYGDKYQVFIRNLDDVEGGNAPPATGLFSDDFEGGNLDKWTVVSVTGDQKWVYSPTYGNPKSCAKVSGYASSNRYANEDWLITPQIDLAGNNTAKLNFDNATKYDGPAMQVYISTASNDPAISSDWTELTYTKSEGNWAWTAASVDLSTYAGQKIYIGFKYSSTDSATATWEIDNVVIK